MKINIAFNNEEFSILIIFFLIVIILFLYMVTETRAYEF